MNKHGIGIMEVLVAAFVLGILYMAVSNLQRGNRDTLLRIRGRDGATEIAQNVIDSLGSVGLARYYDVRLKKDGIEKLILDTIRTTRSWQGQPGIIPHTMIVPYTVHTEVSYDSTFLARQITILDTVEHVYAKRIYVIVSWPYKNSIQSISISSIIR